MTLAEDIKELHREAMDLVEMAFVAKLKGDLKSADLLLAEAYKKESERAKLLEDRVKLLVDEKDFEPTRSILYRNAASLALECNDFRGAEKFIALGLAGNPPDYIEEELEDLLEKASSQCFLGMFDNLCYRDTR